jgi:hypothetical protein
MKRKIYLRVNEGGYIDFEHRPSPPDKHRLKQNAQINAYFDPYTTLEKVEH